MNKASDLLMEEYFETHKECDKLERYRTLTEPALTASVNYGFSNAMASLLTDAIYDENVQAFAAGVRAGLEIAGFIQGEGEEIDE